MNRILMIGVGNRYRQDDGAGPFILDLLKKAKSELTLIEAGDDLLGILDLWKKEDTVYWLDTVSSGSKPGTIHFFDLKKSYPSVENFKFTTHLLHPLQICALSEEMDISPRRIFFIGIEGHLFGYGMNMSQPVQRSAQHVVQTILSSYDNLIDGNFKIT